ncbi:kinase-like protein [Mitosporidium daphniae]|uniref:Kinase-like protein n=1 Tax=Mitosporidium daphniae TaxID=1485682 RepID=A0A098VVU1_9MICR|nr:kinase-like protein [Mitosporidium daphniae]KGG53040.1 kinase-like protein [Mitosporidium daphniae]|eukprot:XP_013239476.1 kinase-like protein [Mitosporidium daphniae]
MAPELLRKSGYRGSIDWWSLGIVMYELMFGRRPFKGNTKVELMKAIMKGQFPIVKGKYSQESIDFLKSLLKMNPKRRIGFEDGIHYQVSSALPDQKCTCLDSENDENLSGGFKQAKESSFKSIMRHRFFKKIDWNKLNEKQVPSPYRPNPLTFHFDLMHEVNAVLNEKSPLKPSKLKNSEVDLSRVESLQKVEKEFKYYNWEQA